MSMLRLKRGIAWKKYFLNIVLVILIFQLALTAGVWAQVTVNNPDKPRNKKAGRVVQLEEVMRIRDDGKNFVLRNPQELSVQEDGSIIFFDYPYIYKFDSQGKFIFKIPKEGQGPGECQYPNSYIIEGERIRIYSWVPPKVLEYNLAGEFLKEVKTPYHGPFNFIDLVDGRIYGIRDEIRFSEAIRHEGIINTPYRLYEISGDFKNLRKIHDIMMEHYIKNARWVKRAMFNVVLYKHFLFYVHSADYSIEKFDLRNEKVERIFGRRYMPQSTKEEEQNYQDPYERYPKGFRPPRQHEFYIQRLQIFRDALWVKTSTEKDEGSQWLIDVFDLDGNYIDCFYLAFPLNKEIHNSQFTISGDGYIFVNEENEETGFVSIGKYKVKSK